MRTALKPPRRLLSSAARARSGTSSRGQSLVEFALALPILLILIFGVIDFSMGLRSYVSLTNAAREGARFAAVGNPGGAYPGDCDGSTSTTAVGRVCVAMADLRLANLQDVSVTYPNGQTPGDSVVISAQYRYDYITPLGDLMDFFSGGAFPDFLTLDTSTDMRLE